MMKLLRGRSRPRSLPMRWRHLSRRWNPRHPLEITYNPVILRELPGVFQGLRVAQLSDLHHGLYISLETIERAVDMANGTAPDVIALTGDFITFSRDYVSPMARALGRLRAPMGVYAVLGNHDYRAGADFVTRELRRHGITVLRNTHVVLNREEQQLCVVGVDDLWFSCDLHQALRGVPAGIPKILLSHNPGIITQAACYGFDLVLSGHTHGGQIRLPVLGSVYRGARFSAGWDCLRDTQIYVSRGLGKSVLPLRIGCPPEIAVFELRGHGVAPREQALHAPRGVPARLEARPARRPGDADEG